MREMDLDTTDKQFTRNWFRNRNLATFREHVAPQWAGKPGLTYLELGVFEGASMLWMLQHILTGVGSRAVGIDPWQMTTKLSADDMNAVWARAVHNTFSHNGQELPRILVRGSSAEVLRRMNARGGYCGIGKASVDICMVDGNHFDYAVLDDARQCLPLMKPGGLLLFDDVENDHEKSNHVKQGIALWQQLDNPPVRLLWKDKYMEGYVVL